MRSGNGAAVGCGGGPGVPESYGSPSYFARLRARREFPLLVTGLVLAGLLLAEIAILWIWDPQLGRSAAAGMGAEILTGREGGIPVALAGGVPTLLVWQISVTQDIAGFALVYPWFLMFYHERHGSGGFVMRRLEAIERAARRHKKFARKWGPFGIFLFMLTPFLINGPMVGGVLGRLVGIRTRFLILPVVLSTAISAAGYVFFFDWTVGLLEIVDPRLGYAVAGTLFTGFLIAGAIGLFIDERNHRRNQAAEAADRHDDESQYPLD